MNSEESSMHLSGFHAFLATFLSAPLSLKLEVNAIFTLFRGKIVEGQAEDSSLEVLILQETQLIL